jgi:hypothetical protein
METGRGMKALTPGIKGLECEADQSPSFTCEIKNAWGYTAASPYRFMALCIVKNRNDFDFPILTLQNTMGPVLLTEVYLDCRLSCGM